MVAQHWLPDELLRAWQHHCDLPTPRPPAPGTVFFSAQGDAYIWPGRSASWVQHLGQLTTWCETSLRGPWLLRDSPDLYRITLLTRCRDDHTLARMTWG
jgi:hypothetical protein